MHKARLRKFFIAFGLIRTCPLLFAQTDQFLPEVGLYSRVHNGVRFQFQAKLTREANEPVQAEIGPGVDFYLHPLARLVDIAKFDLDDAKARVMVLSAGYRYLPQANGGAATNRI